MTGLVRTDRLDPEAIAEITAGRWLTPPDPQRTILGAAIDSRDVRPGNIFFAFKGAHTDGHAHLEAAARAGAATLILETRPPDLSAQLRKHPGAGVLLVKNSADAIASLAAGYRREITGVRTIGVTGSNGKTTAVRLIHAALKAARLRGSHSLKSHNNSLGVPLTILNADPADDYLICEIGTSSPGEIRPLAKMVRPEIGVITSVGRAHLESLGSIAGVAREKAELVRALDASSVAIITGDSPELDTEIGRQIPCRVIRVGISPDSDVVVSAIKTHLGQTSFLASKHRMEISLPGAHNACNAAIALTVAKSLGVDLEKAAVGLAAATGPEMRLEQSTLPIRGGSIHLINDAYNANPESMNAAIREFAAGSLDPACESAPTSKSPPPRRVAVLGSMLELGDQADGAHKEIVDLIAGFKSIGLAVFIGPDFARAQQSDPKFRFLAEDSGGDPANKTAWPASVAAWLLDGDIVLLKGSRGARLERLIGAACSRQPDAVG